MDVIVTGGRNYNDFAKVADVLDAMKVTRLIQGGATGADALAREWAQAMKVECITVNADWERHGRAAGPIRNEEMIIQYPDAIVVAFPGGSGTKSCVKIARDYNLVILCVQP